MRKFRLIPSLLLKGTGFYKTIKFDSPKYIGDSINTIKLFNDKEVDEILIFDIDASKNKRGPDFTLIEELGSECFVPLCYGGGVTTIKEVEKLFSIGVEKVSLGISAYKNPELVKEAAVIFGNQSIVVCADIAKNIWGKYVLAPHGKKTSTSALDYIKSMVDAGAGEIIINDVERDGTYQGFNQSLIADIAHQIQVPIIATGGAQSIHDLVKTAMTTKVQALAAGSLFVYYGDAHSVLINYPTEKEVDELIRQEMMK